MRISPLKEETVKEGPGFPSPQPSPPMGAREKPPPFGNEFKGIIQQERVRLS
jgi:hypothetical protein